MGLWGCGCGCDSIVTEGYRVGGDEDSGGVCGESLCVVGVFDERGWGEWEVPYGEGLCRGDGCCVVVESGEV